LGGQALAEPSLGSNVSIARSRLIRQSIAAPQTSTPAEVVARLGALQGQDYAGAKWSVGLRLADSRGADVEAALEQRAIVRTWLFRGTLHLVAGTDVRWMLELVAARQIAASARRYRQLELDSETLTRSSTVLATALRDGQERDRGELFALLEQHGIATGGQRGYHMLGHASLNGLICQTTAARNVPTFVALDERVPISAPLTREAALAELARRYFTSRGPATLKDFIWWCGLAPAEARIGLDAAAPSLRREQIGEATYWSGPGEQDGGDAACGVFALPGFDEYLLGYADRRAMLDPQYSQRIVPGGNGMFMPTIVSDGQVIGTWKRTIAKNHVLVTPEPFRALNDSEQAGFAAAAERYGEFLELPASIMGAA
jgi:hypothetical protein